MEDELVPDTCFEGHEFTVWSLAFTPDSRYIVSGGQDATIRVWDLHSGSLVHILVGHRGAVYGISMIFAALGYFAFIYFVLFRLVPADIEIAGRFGFSLFYAIFLGILVPSIFWMPLTYAYIGNPSAGIWTVIRLILILVGLSSAALVWALLNLQIKEPAFPYWLAVAGSAYFAFHAAVLDMLLWPILFRM